MLSRCLSVRAIDWKESLKQKILAAQKTLNDLQLDPKSRVSVPENIASEITQTFFDYLGHPGISTFIKTASRFFSIPNLKQRVTSCRSQCALCQRYQIGKTNYGTLTGDLQTSEPFKHLASDVFGPVDCSKSPENHQHQKFWILTILDRCTHWVNLSVLYDIQPKSIIRSVQVWINENGTPETLLSDRGRQYIASEFKEFLEVRKIAQILCASYSPTSNGMAERINRGIKFTLEHFHHLSITAAVACAEQRLRNCYHRGLHCSLIEHYINNHPINLSSAIAIRPLTDAVASNKVLAGHNRSKETDNTSRRLSIKL